MSNPVTPRPQHNADEGSLPTKLNANIHAARLDDMMPGVTASDERDARRFQADKRRLSGMALTSEELHRELVEILAHLTTRLMHHDQGLSSLLKTPSQALDYVERTSAYAMKDYPREFGGNADIAGLWDTLDCIHTISYKWRQGERKDNGKAIIGFIKKIVINALDRVYPNPDDMIGDDDSTRKSLGIKIEEQTNSASTLPHKPIVLQQAPEKSSQSQPAAISEPENHAALPDKTPSLEQGEDDKTPISNNTTLDETTAPSTSSPFEPENRPALPDKTPTLEQGEDDKMPISHDTAADETAAPSTSSPRPYNAEDYDW